MERFRRGGAAGADKAAWPPGNALGGRGGRL